MDFKKWNDEFGGEKAIEDLKKAKENEYTEVEDGVYKCKLEKLELAESKNGKPMIKGQFRIIEGIYKKQCLFINQVITNGFPLHKGLEFLRSLEIFDEDEIDFDGDYEALNDLIMDMAEDAVDFEFDVKKSTDGDYTRLEIEEVYED